MKNKTKLTISKLKEICKEKNIKYKSSWRKNDYIVHCLDSVPTPQNKKDKPKREVKEQQKKDKPKEPKKKSQDKQQKLFGKSSEEIDWIQSRRIENSLVIATLKPNLYLYRGNRKKITLEEKGTYFAPWYGTCNYYMGTKKGYLNIYRLKNNNLRLLDISDLTTINTLLRNHFHDKETYNLIKGIFIHYLILIRYEKGDSNFNYNRIFSQLETETQPWQLKKPIRNSNRQKDFQFVNFLCKQNFDGYIAEDMHDKTNFRSKEFPAEIMLCNPQRDVELMKEIHRTKFRTITAMTKEVTPYIN